MGTIMRVLVACEFSGIVRDAFIAHGHDAISADLLPSERPGPHYEGDVRDLLTDGEITQWDLLIAHPPCTYLTNAGVRHLYHDVTSVNGRRAAVNGPERWEAMREAATFFRTFLYASKIPRIAVENPVPHGYAVEEIGRKYDQLIQPWQFGHGETKAICWWLEGLPPLRPTNIVDGREPRVHYMSPGPNRWRERSRFYPGIAEAMAAQWGDGDFSGTVELPARSRRRDPEPDPEPVGQWWPTI